MCFVAVLVFSLVSVVIAQTPTYVEPASVQLVAGQHIDAGTVTVTVDANGICVKFNTGNDFVLLETHLWVGLRYADMPAGNKGNIKIGHFPYSSKHSSAPYPVSKEYCITWTSTCFNFANAGEACDQTIWVASHASVAKWIDGALDDSTQETAWGKPERTGKSWGGPFTVTVKCGEPPESTEAPSPGCGTGWARSDESETRADVTNYDFEDYLFQRWGWFQCISAQGIYESVIYVGGGNHPKSSEKVGVMNYVLSCPDPPDGICELTIQYQMGTRKCVDETITKPYTLDEVHVRVFKGSINYPNLDSVAPGDYEIPEGKNFEIDPRVTQWDANPTITKACVMIDGTNPNKKVCDLRPIKSGEEICIAAHAVACDLCGEKRPPIADK